MASVVLSTVTVGYKPFGEPDGTVLGPYPGTFAFPNAIEGALGLDFVWQDDDPVSTIGFTGTTVYARSAGVFIVADPGIPSNAVISSVRITAFPNGFIGVNEINTLNVFTSKISTKIARTHGEFIESGTSESIPEAGISFDILVDSLGEAWTIAKVLDEVYGFTCDTGAHATSMTVGEVRLEVFFEPPTPTINTASATFVTENSAQLNAAVNPNGATPQYPVDVTFGIGTEPTGIVFSDTVPVTATGSSVIIVGSPISGLANNTTYYFQAKATYNDVEILAPNVESFTTGATNKILRVF